MKEKKSTVRHQFTIEDLAIEPFYIVVTEECHTLMIRDDKVPYGYYTNFEYLLVDIARYKLIHGSQDEVMDLHTYLSMYRDMIQTVSKALEGWKK